jgi:hypothetical protein
MPILLLGCMATDVPLSTKEERFYQYEIGVTANGRDYTFRQYYKCSLESYWSSGTGETQTRWRGGMGTTITSLGGDLALIFGIEGGRHCGMTGESEVSRIATLLVSPTKPEQMYYLRPGINTPPALVNFIRIKQVPEVTGSLGPSKEQSELKELIRTRQNGFQRVTAQIIPYDVWATSEGSRAYFAQFHSVEVAKVDETPPVSGQPQTFVQFPYAAGRKYKREDGRVVGLKEINLVYDSDAFRVAEKAEEAPAAAYATAQTANRSMHSNPFVTPRFAVVDYKGTKVNVVALQEIYDPESKNILRLQHWYVPFPWPGPDEIDLRRLSNTR